MTVYGYIRVSTDKQTTENQRFEIDRYLTGRGFHVDVWINETISGTVDFKKRKIGKMLCKIKKDDILICSELSRLGRNTLDILTLLNFCMKNQVQVWTVKENYRLGKDIQSQLLACVFSMVAQVERTLIAQRTKEALQRRKAEGKSIERPKGAKGKKHVLDGKENAILTWRRQGVSVSEIARKTNVSTTWIYKHLKKEKSV